MDLSFRERLFAPLIDLSSRGVMTLTVEAPMHWLGQEGFRSWGASMLLHENTRKHIRASSTHMNDDRLLRIVEQKVQAKEFQDASEARLFKIRLLFYLGIYDDHEPALSANLTSSRTDIRDWSTLLLEQGRYARMPSCYRQEADVANAVQDDRVRFLLSLLKINELCIKAKSSSDFDKIQRSVNSLQNPTGMSANVFDARKLRYMAQSLFISGDRIGLKNLWPAIEKLSREIDAGAFLEKESLRRLLFYYGTKLLTNGDLAVAYRSVAAALDVDPYCSAVHTLKGLIEEQIGLHSLARTSYQSGYALGYTERDHCFRKIDSLTASPSTETRVSVASEISALWSTSERAVETKMNAQNVIMRTSAFQKFYSLWTMERDSSAQRPHWYKQLSNSIDAFTERRDLLYSSCYFQSLQTTGFRERITREALAELGDLNRFNINVACSVSDFKHSNDLIENLKTSLLDLKSDPMRTCYVSRIFLYFGLEEDAMTATRWVWDQSVWGPFESYIAYTNLLLLYRARNDKNYFAKAQEALRRFPKTSETFRMQLILCIQCGGYFGKQGDVEKVRIWHQLGTSILEKILSSSRFAESEKLLLHSRWYRFSSFLPHLEKDSAKLKVETDLYVELAHKALSTEQSPFTIENMYAVYETRARIAEATGKREEAYKWFQKLRDEVDPFDSKVEINLGDMKEKLGDFIGALEHYEAAKLKGPPLRDLALFKIGSLEKRLGRKWQSAFELSRFEELRPDSIECRNMLQELMINSGKRLA